DRCPSGGPSHGHSKVLEKRIEGISQASMTIDKVQHFVKEEEHATASRREEASQGLCPRRRGLRHSPQRLPPRIPGQLVCQTAPRCPPASLWVPGIAHKSPSPGLWYCREPGRFK